ncbi:hypothetical protein [Mixta sp. Marseille-Q2659]|uniref:hypothetical protein n=1 Tax=Mixta sp. Marseille-Q2659 TaxID=2736607 RepID=UPI0023B8C403|nr:hypothetical protein [Mixta sp. Marseille-Q2659]
MTDKELWMQAFKEAENVFKEADETLYFTAEYEQVKAKLTEGIISPDEAERELARHHTEYRESFPKD